MTFINNTCLSPSFNTEHDSKTLQGLNIEGIPSKKRLSPDLEKKVAVTISPHTFYTPMLEISRSVSPIQITASAQHVHAAIVDDIENFSPHVDYNGLAVVTQFVNFVEKQDSMREAQAFLRFSVNSQNDVSELSGSACSGQTIHLIDELKKNHEMTMYEVVERNSPTASPHHALGAIFCEDGVVLIDSSLHAKGSKAIIIRPGEVTTAVNIYNGKMEFRLKPGTNIIEKKSFTPTGEKMSEIVLAPLSNPDECVMKQFMLNRPWYAITGCDTQGVVVSVLRVDLCQEKLIFQKGTGSQAIKLALPFSAFNLETKQFDLEKMEPKDREKFLKIGDDFFTFFKISKEDLFKQIGTLIKNKTVVQNLYTQTRAPKTPAPGS
jgi:hypothetical protein